ncbi:hypothetical protein FH972_018520 [Carpinus fangiana]|uniref:Uncharacterized protein n=1 Tax=Carpinus fangiana TaxID=176857 RepID=A0A5N6RM71_9ROSI|nr:hypothetical protein FH972_018520 [Carpinus fangiana]
MASLVVSITLLYLSLIQIFTLRRYNIPRVPALLDESFVLEASSPFKCSLCSGLAKGLCPSSIIPGASGIKSYPRVDISSMALEEGRISSALTASRSISHVGSKAQTLKVSKPTTMLRAKPTSQVQ